MAKKKNLRANNTYLVEGGNGDNPKLMARSLNDGRESLYLEYYYGFETVISKGGNEYKKALRQTELLNLYLWTAPRTPIEREENKNTRDKAKAIRNERAQQLLESTKGYRVKKKNINLLDYFQNFVDNVKVADKRVIRGALKNFRDFLAEEYPHFQTVIYAQHITPDMIQKFVEYLDEHHKGQGAETYYKRFKRIINNAVDNDVIRKSPCRGISTAHLGDMLAKDILSADELQTLFATHYDGENPEIRRAFAMTCLSGIRHCDIVKLKYSNVDYANKLLRFRQSKTQKKSSKSGVQIPLNDVLLALIGTKPENAKDDLIFHLPTMTMCQKALRRWTKRAGIDKHITWHCGRHSFATILLDRGSNIKVVADLLGHSTLKFTELYVRAVEKAKRGAIDSLPTISLTK